MQESDLRFFKEQLEFSNKVQYDLFVFTQHARIQFLSSHLQYLQFLSTIIFALISAALAFGVAEPSFLWLLAMALALVFVVYVASYVRETNDWQVNSLEQETLSLKEKHTELEGVVSEAIKKGDRPYFEKYILDAQNKKNLSGGVSYAGEIANMFFYCILSVLVVAFFDQVFSIGIALKVVLAISVLVASVFVAVKDWSLDFNNWLSNVLHIILKKPTLPQK